jgi:omega-3 fatty acid desaturase (delta-15 desaturase)
MEQCERLLPTEFLFIAFPVYWYLQGTMLMALFVLGHDCGHGSFSKYACVNDVIGTVLHAIVLTPYYPWKISHRNHHKNTGNIDKDEVFYPIRKNNDNGNKFVFLFGLGVGWFVYLWRGYHPRKICHFNPLEAMFGDHVTGCTLSISAVIGWVICLHHYACSMGFMGLVKYYVIPELVFGSWLLIVTFLHHIEEDTPWYSGKSYYNCQS